MTTIPTTAAQVGEGRTPHYVRVDGFHAKALCNRMVSRQISDRDLPKFGAPCKACTKALAALNAPAAEVVEATPAAEVVEATPAAEVVEVVEVVEAAAEETPAFETAKAATLLAYPTASDFEPVAPVDGDGPAVGWTYRSGDDGGDVFYGWVAADGKVDGWGLSDTRDEAAAALANWNTTAAARAAGTPIIHRFDNTIEAYDATQCRDDIQDGDVLVIESERVVGFLRSAWPGAITTERGHLHGFTTPARDIDSGKYTAAADLAEATARDLGFDIDALHTTPVAPAAEDVPAPAAETEADAMPADAAPQAERFVYKAETVLAYPGHREDRITVTPVGGGDPVMHVALPRVYDRTPRTVLGALGWRILDGGPDGVAGYDADSGDCGPTTPTDSGEAQDIRDAVWRETVARLAAHADHTGARHFRAVMPDDGGLFPIGWTYATTGYGENSAFGWVTALGRGMDRVGVPTREDAERMVRDWAAAGKDAPTDTAMADTMADLPMAELHKVLVVLHSSALRNDAAPMPAQAVCTHGATERPGDVTAPAAACAAKDSAVSVGVFSDEGCVDRVDCAVEAAAIADDMNREDDDAKAEAADGQPRYRWAVLCPDHEEQPAIGCEDCATDEDDQDAEDAEEAGEDGDQDEQAPAMPAPFVQGDRIVCPDGVARTVRGMAPTAPGAPALVVDEDGDEWAADSCRRANPSDIQAAREASARAALRVRTNPDADDPEWQAALTELGEMLDLLKVADPFTRAALTLPDAQAAVLAVHTGAHDFQEILPPGNGYAVGWSFQVDGDEGARYGVVGLDCVISPVGLYEYRTTAERAFLYAPTA